MKKLLGKLKDVEDHNKNIDEVNETSTQKRFSQSSRVNEQRDIDAKVLYQYPKGQFRFPLIPDEETGGRVRGRTPRVHSEKEKQNVEVEQRIKPKVIRQDSVKKVVDTRGREPIQDHSPKTQKSYSKRPFRPTEIPSPIYGFEQRPRKSEEVVEYELDDFTGSDNANRTESLVFHPHKDKIEETYNFSDGEEAPKIIEVLNRKEEKDRIKEVTIHEPVNVHKTSTVGETDPIIESFTMIENEHDEDEARIHEEEESPYFPEDNLDGAELEGTIKQVKYNSMSETIAAKDGFLEEGNNVQESYTNEIVDVNDNAFEETVDEFMNDSSDIQKNSIDVLEDSADGVDDEEVPAASYQAEERETAQRSHIPFNVIMLKQDKIKLEQRLSNKLDEGSKASAYSEAKVDDFKESTESLNQAMNEVAVSVEEENVEELEYAGEYYVFPSKDLLKPAMNHDVSNDWLDYQSELLNETLINFNVRANVVNVTQGPSVTRFEVQPEPGVKVNKITNLSDDIKLSLAAKDIRIEAPIPGKHTIGIEVPNPQSRPVFISEIVNSPEFLEHPSSLAAVLGLDISGKPIVTDLRKMPHGLIAGATGSGKSVCINTILVSLLYKANPSDVKLLLIDPKMVELAPYNQIPHLVSPVITDVKAATAALKWAVEEMERRYELFAHTGVREITRFNELAESHKQYSNKLPYIVIIIDELADLMMMAPGDVEEAICRIAQKARACGIHLIIATQRPSVDVITGLIKANVPTRIAFSVSSQIDSRTIIDISGAEKLLGKGDMLFLENGSSKPVRLQGTFVSDEEIDAVVAHVKREQRPQYLFEQEELLKRAQITEDEDELFFEACEFVIEQGGASTSSLQRRFKIGYNRAARLIDMMQDQGFISEARGSKPRDVLITESDLESIHDTSTIN